jgi:hypothetical protein
MSDWKYDPSDIMSDTDNDSSNAPGKQSESYLDGDTLGSAFSPVHVPFSLVGVYALFELQAFTASVASVVGTGILAEIIGVSFALVGLLAVGIPVGVIGGAVLALLFGILFRDSAAILASLVIIIPSAAVIGAGILFVPLPPAVAAFVAFDLIVYALLIIVMFVASSFALIS